MPYVNEEQREEVLGWLGKGDSPEFTPGQVNFLITTILDEWVASEKLCYDNINEAIGILECVKMEFYRRIAAPYEDEKMIQNGDVYSDSNLPD